MSGSENPWLTIITIVRNDPQGFTRTIESVSTQDLDGVQVLVIDGSEDRDVIRGIIEASGVSVDYAWEPPAGVYPAMNTGLQLARGEFSIFTNAGDALASATAVSEIRRAITSTGAEWGYGQVRFVEPNGDATLPTPFDYSREKSRSFSAGRFPPHQGTFARTQLLRDLGGFDTRFRICADYAMFLGLSKLSEPVELESVIADFFVGGLSTVAWRESLKEFHAARQNILKPSGVNALREQFGTWSQVARMSAARLIRR